MRDAVVRDAAERDVAAITAIYRAAVLFGTATFEIEPPGEAEMAARFAAITGAGHPFLVAEDDGRVVGYAYANWFRTRPAYRFTVEDSIYIAEAAQGRGIGKRLLGELIGQSEARGYRQMVAVIGDSAQVRSIALHRMLGFAMAGTLPSTGYKFGRWLDTVLMSRPIGAGDTTLPDSPGVSSTLMESPRQPSKS